LFRILNLGHWDLPFDLAQGGELVEPFEIGFLMLGIFMIFIMLVISVKIRKLLIETTKP